MTAGIQVFNNNNMLQINGNERNLVLKGKGFIPLSNPWPHSGIYEGKLVLSDPSEQIAFNVPADVPVAVYRRMYLINNQIEITFISKTSGVQVTYYRFGVASVTPGSHFEVFDTNSNLVFSDAHKYMKIIDAKYGVYPCLFTDDTPAFTNTSLATTYDSRDKAVLCGNLCFYMNPGSTEVYQGFIFNSSYVESRLFLWRGGESKFPYCNHEVCYNYLVLDVTGL